MKRRPPKRRPRGIKQLNVDLPADLLDALDDFCDTRGVLKKDMVEVAVRAFMSREEQRGEPGEGVGV